VPANSFSIASIIVAWFTEKFTLDWPIPVAVTDCTTKKNENKNRMVFLMV
jgi:hypothetical protein